MTTKCRKVPVAHLGHMRHWYLPYQWRTWYTCATGNLACSVAFETELTCGAPTPVRHWYLPYLWRTWHTCATGNLACSIGTRDRTYLWRTGHPCATGKQLTCGAPSCHAPLVRAQQPGQYGRLLSLAHWVVGAPQVSRLPVAHLARCATGKLPVAHVRQIGRAHV